MTRRLAGLLFAMALLSQGSRAGAVIGTIDAVPAATLLLPYFEVDLDDPQGITTLFSVNNAFPEPAIAHVTLWTDLGIPTFDFNVFLTGYDVVTFNLRDLFVNGRVPATSPADTTISPVGPLSVSDPTAAGLDVTSCQWQLPLPDLPWTMIEHLQLAHTGQASALFAARCAGEHHGDRLARGYVTIDNVRSCTMLSPAECEQGYFRTGGAGDARNANQLWGDYFLVEDAAGTAFGNNLVHIEAASSLGAGNYTFYRRLCSQSGQDQREGLASQFALRFVEVQSVSTQVLFWRDPLSAVKPFACEEPDQRLFPFPGDRVFEFDEQENLDDNSPAQVEPLRGQARAPRAATRVRAAPPATFAPAASPADLALATGASGWLLLDLNGFVRGSNVGGNSRQNWVTVITTVPGQFSVGFDAIQLDNVTFPATRQLAILPECDGPPDPVVCD